MSRVRQAGRAAAIAVALLGVLGATSFAARASELARSASASQQVTSGSWAALPTVLASPPYLTQSLVLTFPLTLLTPSPQYFWAVNTGSLTLTGATYSMSITGTLGATASLAACVNGSWNESTGACSGTVTTILSGVSSSSSTSSTIAPTAAGSEIRLKATVSSTVSLADTVTIGVSVSRTQVRAATTTTS